MEGSEIDISQSETSNITSSLVRSLTSDIHNHTRTPKEGEPIQNERNQLIYYHGLPTL